MSASSARLPATAPADDVASTGSLTDRWRGKWAQWRASGQATQAAPALAAVTTIFVIAISLGGVDAWSQTFAAAALGLTMLVLAYVIATGFTATAPSPILIVLSVLYAGLMGFIYLQAVPGALPSHPVWQLAEKAANITAPASASMAPDATRLGLFWLVFYGLFFWVCWWPARKADTAKAALRWFLALQCLLAFYGAIVYSTGNAYVGLVERVAYTNALTATFVNKNSYATFVGMGAILSFTILARRLLRDIDSAQGIGDKTQQVLTGLFNRHLAWVLTFGALVLVVASSQSRAGLASTLVGLVVVILLLTLRKNNKIGTLAGATVLLAVAIYAIVNIGGEQLGENFDNLENSASVRSNIYAAAVQAAKEAPLTGTGLGSFQYDFYNYLSRDLVSTKSYYAAHNTYLENIIELGWPAAAALVLCPLVLTMICWRAVFQRRRDYEYALAAVGVSAQVGLHSLFDFSLQIPAVTCAYVFVLAQGVAQSVSSKGR